MVREVVLRQAAAGLEEDGVQQGEHVPDFELPNSAGRMVRLNDLLDKGPVVIVFYRGGWCPFCTAHLKALQDIHHEIKARGAQIVAISLEKPDAERSATRLIGPDFELLHDEQGHVSRLFGLLYDVSPMHEKALGNYGVDLLRYHGSKTAQLPLAATYVVAQDGTAKFAFVDVHPNLRAEPDDILAALDEIGAA